MYNILKIFTLVVLLNYIPQAFGNSLNVVEDEVIFNNYGDPIEINLTLTDSGNKIIKWDSAIAIDLSSKILVTNEEGESMGFYDNSDIKFIAMGASQNKEYYKLAVVINNNIKQNKNINVNISFKNSNISSDTLKIVIPRNDFYDKKDAFHVKNYATKNDLESELNKIFISVLLLALGIVASLYFSLKKNNKVTEEKTTSLDTRIRDNFEKSTDKYHKIINSTEKIIADTTELRKLSEKMDNNIYNFSLDPEKYKKELEKNIKRYKKIINTTKCDIETRDQQLLGYHQSLNQLSFDSLQKIEGLNILVKSLEEIVQNQEKYIIESYNIISNLVPINNESIRSMVIEEFGDLNKNHG